MKYVDAIEKAPFLSSNCKSIENKSKMMKLKRYLFCDYDTTVRPANSHQMVTNVTVKLMPKLLEFVRFL